MVFFGRYGALCKGLLINSSMRPWCETCKERVVAVNYIKEDVRHYRKQCDVCLRKGKKIKPQPPLWAKKGYKKKPHCEKCGFVAELPDKQLHVFHVEGNLKNVDWVKLMNNIRGYISAGGSAHWDMLVYGYNEHQVDECEQLARDIGFTWFRAKVSKRGSFDSRLQPATGWLPPVAATGPINCHALAESSVYIDAQGRMSPCCWLAGRKFIPEDQFNTIQQTWNTNTPNTTCKATCSGSTTTPFTNNGNEKNH